MKLLSWNVNGIRACITKGFLDSIKKINPDIICLQETKALEHQVDMKLENYYQYWNSAEKKGYSGTAIFTKIKPLSVTYGMNLEEHDNEGRIITLEFDDYYLTTVYTPNSKRELTRLEYRQIWDKEFLKYMKKLEKKKPVIFCGDLNVAHKEIDIKNFQSNKTTATKPGSAGFTDEEREGFDNILNADFIDTFRYFYPNKEEIYSWWSYMFHSRDRNTGWRIDYFITSKSLNPKLKDAAILDHVLGSDHCPVVLELKE